MSNVATVNSQLVYAVNAVVLRSMEQNHFSVALPGDNDPAAQVIKTTMSAWQTNVISGHRFQSDRFKIFIITPDFVRFRELVSQWRKDRNPLSSNAWDNFLNPSYQRIIGMGEKALPFILQELQNELRTGEPDDWFVALWAITGGENPVPEESRGNVKAMAQAWLEWGSRSGYVNDEGVASRISTFGRLGVP
jgi:hypothetical protein